MKSIQFDNQFRKYEAIVHGKYSGCISPTGKMKISEETKYMCKIREQFDTSPQLPAAFMLTAIQKHRNISMENLLNELGKGVSYKDICDDFTLFTKLSFIHKNLIKFWEN